MFDELKEFKSIYEYDVFIGENNYLSKGIGGLIVKKINDYIYNNCSADCIVLRPFERNIRAIRCYEKNGFMRIKLYNGTDTIGNQEEIMILLNTRI